MKNIHTLPTDKPSILYAKDDNYKLANNTMAMDWYISSAGYKPHNIYITSNEEIKEGDWFISGSLLWKVNQNIHLINPKKDKKIILTTDPDLIADGVQVINDEFLEWFVKNPSCEFVEVYNIKSIGYPYDEYSIIVPEEEPEEEVAETLEDFIKRESKSGNESVGIVKGVKWQAKRMYSEITDDCINDWLDYRINNSSNISFVKWFE